MRRNELGRAAVVHVQLASHPVYKCKGFSVVAVHGIGGYAEYRLGLYAKRVWLTKWASYEISSRDENTKINPS